MRNPLTNTELNARINITDTKVDDARTRLNQRSQVKYVSVSFAAATGTADIVTATDGDVFVEDVLIYSLTAGADLTSVSIQTDDTTPFEVMTAAEGAVAELTAEKTIKTTNSQKSFYLASGKKLQYTITGTGDWGAYVAIKYRIISSGSLE